MQERMLRIIHNWRIWAYGAVLLLAALFLLIGNRVAAKETAELFDSSGEANVVPARVLMILSRDAQDYSINTQALGSVTIMFEAEILKGERKGTVLTARQVVDSLVAAPVKMVDEGDRVMLCYTSRGAEQTKSWMFQEYDRSVALLVLAAVFMGLLLLFGGKKGVSTIFSLAFTCLSIFTVFIPAILAGRNIYISVLVVCMAIIIASLSLVNGFNLKSLSAGVGCLGGLAVSGILLVIMDASLKLTGYVDEESGYLIMMNPTSPIDLKAIIFASIIIGALGAALDVGVSIASSLSEICETSPDLGFAAIVQSGMNIGRDILCTMTNTLILVYIGGSLSLTLLLMVYSNSLLELINREMIVVEILQALVGSIGLLFTIPMTAIFLAGLHSRGKLRGISA